MGIRVLEAGPERVRIEAPLAPNLNHRRTAFGGSVAALATLAGWALVHLRLGKTARGVRTVIRSCTVDYTAPIQGPFVAVVEPPGDVAWERFTRALTRYGKGRVRVSGHVESEGRDAASFRGEYVALGTDSPPG